MKSISSKVFLALLVPTTMVLVASLSLARWSFDAGFKDYVDGLEQFRLQSLGSLVEQVYLNHDGWPADIERVFDQTRLNRSGGDAGPPRRRRPEGGYLRAEPPHKDRPPGMHPPPRHDEQGFAPQRRPSKRGQPPRDSKRLSADGREPRLPRPGPKRPHPTALFDQNGAFLAGNSAVAEGAIRTTVDVVVNDKKVGELRSAFGLPTDASLESRFATQQLKASIAIAVISVIIALLASWLLARKLLAPVYQMKRGIAKLAEGDYQHRIAAAGVDEMAVLMNDIDRLGLTLDDARETRRRWLADISHELRTPVTIISGELDAIKDGVRSLNMGRIESLSHETDRLSHLIEDLYQLSLSDIGGLRYEFTELDMAELVSGTLESYAARLNECQLTLRTSIQEAVYCRGDVNRLEQLLTNLMNNAIAYTDQPGRIDVSLNKTATSVTLCVADSAPTVAPDRLEKLFEPLYREDESRNRRKSGAGLGLTIARNIVSAHGGTIHASASSLGGIEVRVDLPQYSS